MKIRKATIKDFENLKDIRKEFYLEETKIDSLSRPEWSKNPLSTSLAKELRNKNVVYYIAEDNKKIIGYAAGKIEKCPAFFKYKKRGHLFNIYVKKPYRNKGIGKKLSDKVIEWFKKSSIKWVMILVYSKNKRAYNIYKKNKFEDYMITLNKILK